MIELLNKETTSGAEQLMDNVLRDGGSIREEYPLVFEERFDGCLVSLSEEDVTRASCSILTREFLIGEHKAMGGMIGSVVTDPDYRGRGIGTHMLIQAEAELQIRGAAFAILWAEKPSWYLDRGYGPMSAEHTFLVDRDKVQLLPDLRETRSMRPEDVPAIHACYERHSVRVKRTLAETEALLDCPDMAVLVSIRDGEVMAYACMGRGRDLQGAVHEWGGNTEDVLGLLRVFLEIAYPDGRPFETVIDPETGNEVPVAEHILVMAPPQAVELCLRLESLGVPSMHSMLALGKILDRHVAAQLLSEVLGELANVEVIEGVTHPFRITTATKVGELDDEGVFTLLFGVAEVHQDIDNFLRTFELQGADLPLAPFAWGLDSI